MTIESTPDPDWYLDHVIVPSGPTRREVGPVRAWRGTWMSLAHRCRNEADETPVGDAVRLALTQGFVVTTADTRRCGVPSATARRLVRRGEWTPCGYGAMAVVPGQGKRGIAQGKRVTEQSKRVTAQNKRGAVQSDRATEGPAHDTARRVHALRSAAAVAKRREHVVATASAAVLHGLPTFEPPTSPELFGPSTSTFGRLEAAHVRLADLAAHDLESWFGIPLTTVARTIVDVARFDPRSGLMAADAALHEGLVRRAELTPIIERSAGLAGIQRAREVLAIASPQIESPLESLTHLALRDDGFPPPELQFAIRGADGKRYRVDFAWPDLRLVIEADGRGKYRNDELWKEKQREIALARAGYRVIRVRWMDVVENWHATRAWIREVMATDPSR